MISIGQRRAFGLLTIIVAEAGERPDKHKIMTTNPFSLANRKQLADMLADKYDGFRSKAKTKLRERRSQLRVALEKEFAEKKGALKVMAQLKVEKEKVREIERELTQLGFQIRYDDELCLTGDAGNAISKTIEARIDKEIGTLDDIDARFDSVQIAMMTVATLEDADKLLKSVSSI